jgi:hypothetical protein
MEEDDGLFGKGTYEAFINISVWTVYRPSLVLSALPSHAWDSDRVNVTIPFDFVIGNKQLKAGDYVVELLLDGTALKLRGKGRDVQQIAFTVPNR